MLNFNAIDTNANPSFSHSLHGTNFNEAPAMVTSSSSNQQHHHHSTVAQAQQMNLSYLGANTSGNQSSWTHSESVHNTSNSTIDVNCNQSNNSNNNLSNPSETSRVIQHHQKDYLQTVIGADDSNGRLTLNMGNFLQQKGSENVKRFSVNNLLQLANNCRALVDENRLSTGKW